MKTDIMEDTVTESIVIPTALLDLFLSQDKPAELIALYIFYQAISLQQNDNVIHCPIETVTEGLNWTAEKTRKAKIQLIELGLIQNHQTRDKNKRILGHYTYIVPITEVFV